MTQKEFDEMMRLHEIWLDGEEGGRRAIMQGEDLRNVNMNRADMMGVNMQRANTQRADMQDANMWGADMRGANMQRANMQRANMQHVDMQHADMRSAEMQRTDMRGVNIDYSAWPLCCGSLKAYVDDRIAIQLLYHTLSVVQYSRYVSEDVKRTLLTQDVVDVANRFHRVDECGKLKTWEEIKG